MNSLRFGAVVARRAFSTIPAGSYLPTEVVTDRVLKVLKNTRHCRATLNPSSNFVTDLGFDSAIRKEVNKKLADEFCVRLDAATKESFVSVDAVVKYFAGHPKAR